MKALNDHCACECFETVLVRPRLCNNKSSLELQSLLSFFFYASFQIGGAAYLRVWLIHGLVQYADQEIVCD